MHMVCLDLEGVLVPEIWKAVASRTGIDALNRTTRDEPDYDVLMRYRLDIMDEHNITLPLIQEVIGELEPLPGAKEFTEWLTSRTRVIILSDTFEQFAAPLMKQLGYPTLFCHTLEVDAMGRITGYQLRQPDQKRLAVKAFQSLNFTVAAAGDSFNDKTMLDSADHAILFKPAQAMIDACPGMPVATEHPQLRAELERLLAL